MDNEAENFPENYDPKREVSDLLSGEIEPISADEEKELNEMIEGVNSEILARNSVKEFIGREFNASDSGLDKDALKTIYDEMNTRIEMANNFRGYYGKIRDQKVHGGEFQAEEEIKNQRERILTELNILGVNALDGESKQAIAELIYRLGGKPWES